MKQLTCEMCGGVDLIKTDGYFVCQHCNTKYTVEEAKKMMIEGTVDVQGTVKVDNSAFVEKYLANARRAKQKEDWDEVEKYYNMVEQNDPTNIEAIFYSSYAKAIISLTDSADFLKRQQKFEVFTKSIEIIDDYYDAEKTDFLKPIIIGMSNDIIAFTNHNFLYNQNNGSDAWRTRKLFFAVEQKFVESIENIIKKDEQAYLYRLLVKHYNRLISNKNEISDFRKPYIDKLKAANMKLQTLDPSYKPAEVPEAKGCYVATAVYGSYDCPQVWTLRRYRDYTLAETWYGRAFIRTYYAISPTLVEWFGHTEWFKKMWKGKLDRMVKKLQENGVEGTPYEDKNW